MSMVCGLDLHRGQITFDALVAPAGRCTVAGSGPRSEPGFGVG